MESIWKGWLVERNQSDTISSLEALLLGRRDLSPRGQMVRLSPYRCSPGQTGPSSGYKRFSSRIKNTETI